MSIKIPVQADFDGNSLQQQLDSFKQRLNDLGQQIAQANKAQFNPISKTSLEDMKRMVQQFEHLRRVSGDLNKRINATGQKSSSFVDLDWSKMYPDASSRARQMAKAFSYVTGSQFSPNGGQPSAPPGGQRPQKPNHPGAWTQAGVNAVQAGLNAASGATGGVTGVASRSLGTGMQAGIGAGMMGLLGGVLALGVGKAVSAVAEHIGKAEQDNVDLDRLKRTLGDVNVAFNSLKVAVHSSADRLGLTFEEAGKLSLQYAKQANLSGEKGLHQIPGELATSVGLARSFGLDPSQTGGVLGNMRGLGVTKNETDTRKFALLIGETIGKSDAFAKSDEVMDALSSYMTSQTRATLGGANAEGYAGMFAGLAGSKIPGLDPSGTGALLSRVNASLTAGGARGEASQFFTSIVGSRMGLDPIQTRMMREGGAFSTNDKTFGEGSVWARFMGKSGPSGGQTHLAGQLQSLRDAYGSNKGLLAESTANHLGVNMSQAMALHMIEPKQMGEMSKYANLTELNASGISNMARAVSGTAGDRQSLAKELLGRSGKDRLSDSDAGSLRSAMGGKDSDLRELLTRLSAKYGQEETTGSLARDSKALLDNIKTSLADKLVPYVQDMREGILYLAGDRKKSGLDVLKEIAQKGSENRIAQINKEFDSSKRNSDAVKAFGGAQNINLGNLQDKLRAGVITQDQYDKAVADHKRMENEAAKAKADVRDLEAKRKQALDAEAARLKKQIETLEAGDKAQQSLVDAETKPSTGASPSAAQSAAKPKAGSGAFDDLFAKYGKQYGVDPRILKAIAMKESGLNPNAVGAINNNGTRDYGLMQHNSKYLDDRGLTSDWANPERSVEEAAKLLKKNMAATRGDVRSAVRMYNGSGPQAEAYANDVMSRVGGTQMPDDARAAAQQQRQQSVNVTVSPLRVEHVKPDGSMYAPPEQLQTRVSSPGSSFRM